MRVFRGIFTTKPVGAIPRALAIAAGVAWLNSFIHSGAVKNPEQVEHFRVARATCCPGARARHRERTGDHPKIQPSPCDLLSASATRCLAIFLIVLAAILRFSAEDWTTTDGKTYKNVTVVGQEDGGVRIWFLPRLAGKTVSISATYLAE